MVRKAESTRSFGRSIVRRTSSVISGRIEGGIGGPLIGRLEGASQNLLDLPGFVPGSNKTFPIYQTARILFGNFNSLSTSLIDEEAPNSAAASNCKQS
jgi:hypothetical protein